MAQFFYHAMLCRAWLWDCMSSAHLSVCQRPTRNVCGGRETAWCRCKILCIL